MPKGIVEKEKKAQLDASLKERRDKLKQVQLLEADLSNLKISFGLRRDELQKDFNEFVIGIERERYRLIREVESLKKEKESLKYELYARLGQTMG